MSALPPKTDISRRKLRNLGLPGFLSFQLIVGGNVLAALVHPLFMGALIYSLASGAPMWRRDGVALKISTALCGVTIVTGYLTSIFLGWLGLSRRGLLASASALMLTPLHWHLLSVAAWRGLYKLVVSSYAWEKIEHGLAKSSRLAPDITQSLLELERHLSSLAQTGGLPMLADRTRDISAARRPLPWVAA
jgi:hypothetical protein